MAALGVKEEEFEESFVRSGGPGGQNVNKTSTAVLLVHRPTGIRVRCETERAQGRNRSLAREMILDAIEGRRRQAREAARAEAEKLRRQTRARPRGVQQRILEQKARRSEKKRFRRRYDGESY
jgi:protein subunit release factor B